MFSALSKTEISILVIFKWLSANTFNLTRSKKLLFGKELILFHKPTVQDFEFFVILVLIIGV